MGTRSIILFTSFVLWVSGKVASSTPSGSTICLSHDENLQQGSIDGIEASKSSQSEELLDRPEEKQLSSEKTTCSDPIPSPSLSSYHNVEPDVFSSVSMLGKTVARGSNTSSPNKVRHAGKHSRIVLFDGKTGGGVYFPGA